MTLQLVELRIAMEAGGSLDRGLVDSAGLDELIRERMHIESIADARFADIQTLAHAFAHFGQDIRAAERKGRRIVPHLDEELPKP